MILAASIKKLLDGNMIAYQVLQHKRVERLGNAAQLLKCDPDKILTAQVLEDHLGKLLVVYRLSTKIDLNKLQRLLNRTLTVVATTKVNRLFNDCDAGCWPPIGQAYGLEMVIDKSINKYSSLFFSSGSNTSMVQIQTNDYLLLNSRAKILDFSEALSAIDMLSDKVEVVQQGQFNNLSLPSLPPIILQILELSMNDKYSAKELAGILSKDKVLQQQIMSYSQLPFMNEQAGASKGVVEHMLGFNELSHIATGVTAGRDFTPNDYGYEYAEEFWQHALESAAYAERITHLVDKNLGLNPELSYLIGLFHNFGLLLFSQIFMPEFTILKRWVELNPKVSIAILEKRLLGMGRAFKIVSGGHAQLGEHLLRYWNMPEPICVVAKQHHSLNYTDAYWPYVKIMQLTNQLLREQGIGDGSQSGISVQLLEPLGLTEEQVREATKNIKGRSVSLEQLTRFLTNK